MRPKTGKLWSVTRSRLLAPPPEAVTDSNRASLHPPPPYDTPHSFTNAKEHLQSVRRQGQALHRTQTDLSKTHYSWLLVFILTGEGQGVSVSSERQVNAEITRQEPTSPPQGLLKFLPLGLSPTGQFEQPCSQAFPGATAVVAKGPIPFTVPHSPLPFH